ncbi:PilZ domain-containing protein [Haloimpatiens sp. FM7315]|uniref:PilZ domain-containing protein n=1 Tax=Haloimpatiens sp. FM7315 TaxID=3298609 RepID=UPI0035A2E819
MYSYGKCLQQLSEKRKSIRVDFSLKLYYPLINNKSIYKDYDGKRPILEAINISDTGICFKSIAKADKGDFISFLLKVDDKNPSFWTLCEVKWSKHIEDDLYILGCEFYLLTLNQLSIIRKYIKNTNKNI